MIIFPVGSFLGVVFTFYLYSYRQHGKAYKNLSGLSSGILGDYHVIIVHLLPINILILKGDMFL